MKRSIQIFILLATTVLACAKDAIVEVKSTAVLSEYLETLAQKRISTRSVFVMAGSATSFERATNELSLHVFFKSESPIINAFCFVSDSLPYPDSIAFYHRIDAKLLQSDDQLLNRFALKLPKRERLYRLVYQTNDSIYLSQPMSIGKANQKTEGIDELNIIGSPTGRAEFRWKGFSTESVLNHVFILREPTGNEFCGVLVNTSRFIFYDLRNADLNFSPLLYDPILNLGDRYLAEIFCLDEFGWMRNYQSFGFKADSVNIFLR